MGTAALTRGEVRYQTPARGSWGKSNILGNVEGLAHLMSR